MASCSGHYSSLLLLVAMLICPFKARSSRELLQIDSTVSGTTVVVAQDFEEGPSASVLALRAANNSKYEVRLPPGTRLDGVTSGMGLSVTGAWFAPPFRNGVPYFKASSFSITPTTPPSRTRSATPGNGVSAAGATVAGSGGDTVAAAGITLITNRLIASSVNTLFIPIAPVDSTGAACPGTGKPPMTMTQLRKTLFQENNPTGITVGSTFRQCSYNKTVLTPATSRLANPVKLPCSGTTAGGVTYTFDKCEFADWNAWSDAADEALRSQKVPIDNYFYKVYLMPPGVCDGLVGMGYVGCDGSYECRTWIGPQYWKEPQSIVHELGHNLFLSHAGLVSQDGSFDEYGDESCVMGYCCAPRCFNTPHAWQMGWISTQLVDGRHLTPGKTVVVSLASQATSARSGVRIVPTWAPTALPLFLGYRTQIGLDNSLDMFYAKVNIYASNITHNRDAQGTQWRGALAAANDVWEYPDAKLVLRHRGFAKGSARVSICLRAGAETADSCAANKDNNCDGRAGPKDPACRKFLRTL